MMEPERIEIHEVSFVGWEISYFTTASECKPRWTEFALFRLVNGKYVTEIVAVSNYEGEHDLVQTKVARDAAQMVELLRDKRGRLSMPVQMLLRNSEDKEILEALDGLRPVHID